MPNGKPASGADVFIASVDSNGVTTVADMDGKFVSGYVRAGNYRISVRFPGYPTETEILTIDRDAPFGRTFNVVFNLRPASAPKPSAISRAVDSYERGKEFLKKNELEKALAAFVKAVEENPDFLEAKFSVGYTQYLRKNYEIAAAVFDDVLKQKVEMPEAHLYLGISLLFLKNMDAAEQQLTKAISIKDDERTALAHRYLGGIYMHKKRNAEAADELQKYVDLVPSAPDADRIKSTIADLRKSS
jgi:tetratricopeptide (TPR) repeat protein